MAKCMIKGCEEEAKFFVEKEKVEVCDHHCGPKLYVCKYCGIGIKGPEDFRSSRGKDSHHKTCPRREE